MTTEETEARLLAEWLTTPAGTPPPEGLSLEVVAAVYAMRPDRAPAPRVSIDDIFGKVQSGPYAAAPPSTTEVEAGSGRPTLGAARHRADADAGRGEPGAGRPQRAPKRRLAWWMGPAVGLALSAAAAVMFVLPIAGGLVSPASKELAAKSERANAPTPPPMAPAADEGGAVESPTAGAAPAPTVAEGPSTAVPMEEAPPLEDAAPAEPARAREKGLEGGDASPQDSIAEASGALGRRGDSPASGPGSLEKSDAEGLITGTGTSGASGGAGWGAESSSSPTGRSYDKDEAKAAPPPPASPAPGAAPSTPPASGTSTIPELTTAASAERAADSWAQKKSSRTEEEDAPQAAAKPAPKAKSSQAPAKAPSSRPAAQAPPAQNQAADFDDAEVQGQADSTTRSAGESAGATRSDAAPRDYNPGSVTSRADVAAAYAAAEAARVAGRTDEAIAAYAPLLSDGDARVAQDAAWRQASLLRSVGRADTALGVVKRGLTRSSANTPFRSNLLVLEGDILAARGDSAGAAKAYAEAARLNNAR